MLGLIVAGIIVLGVLYRTELLHHVPIALGTLGTFLGVVYAARGWVDGKERNPDLHRALGERHQRTGQNPTPPREDT